MRAPVAAVATLLVACQSGSGDGVVTSGAHTGDTQGAGDTDDTHAAAVAVQMIAWNVESGDADPDTLATTVAEVEGEALWGLSEVQDESWAKRLRRAAKDGDHQDFEFVLGTTGWDDRLALLWDDTRSELLDWYELHEMNANDSVRAPLVGHIRERSTGIELLVVVNHLYRSNDHARHHQAHQLNTWARDITLPVVTLGDFNFDFDVDGSTRDDGFDLLTEDDVFTWVQPPELVKTQCSPSYNSVLDFVFVAGSAQAWPASSTILYPEEAFCRDDASRSDHRPVSATFELRAGPDPVRSAP